MTPSSMTASMQGVVRRAPPPRPWCCGRLVGHVAVLGLLEAGELALLLGLRARRGPRSRRSRTDRRRRCRRCGPDRRARASLALEQGQAVAQGGGQLGQAAAGRPGWRPARAGRRWRSCRRRARGLGVGAALVDRAAQLGDRLDRADGGLEAAGRRWRRRPRRLGAERRSRRPRRSARAAPRARSATSASPATRRIGEQALDLQLVGQIGGGRGQTGAGLGRAGPRPGSSRRWTGAEAGHGHEDHGRHGDEGQQLRPDVGVSLHACRPCSIQRRPGRTRTPPPSARPGPS